LCSQAQFFKCLNGCRSNRNVISKVLGSTRAGQPRLDEEAASGSVMKELDGRVELKTERMLLLPFRLEDVDDVSAYAKEPEWAQFLPVPLPDTRRDAEQLVARLLRTSWDTRPFLAVVWDSKAGVRDGVIDCLPACQYNRIVKAVALAVVGEESAKGERTS